MMNFIKCKNLFLPVKKAKAINKCVWTIEEVRQKLNIQQDPYTLEYRKVGYILGLGYIDRHIKKLQVPIEPEKKFYRMSEIYLTTNTTLQDVYYKFPKSLRKPFYNCYKKLCNNQFSLFYQILIAAYSELHCPKTILRLVGHQKRIKRVQHLKITSIVYYILGYPVDPGITKLFKSYNLSQLIKRLKGINKKVLAQNNEVLKIDIIIKNALDMSILTKALILLVEACLDKYQVANSELRMNNMKNFLNSLIKNRQKYYRWINH